MRGDADLARRVVTDVLAGLVVLLVLLSVGGLALLLTSA